MKPDPRANPAYVEAFATISRKIIDRLRDVDPSVLPIKLFVAGGAALHLRTGARATVDVDATFSRRVVIDDDLEVSYRDADGRARLLYLDRNYNDTFGLMHEDAQDDSERIDIPGVDRRILEVRILTPLDLAVSKIARLSDQDRDDIATLAREGLIEEKKLRVRAEEALGNYVGNLASVRTSINLACNVVAAARPKRTGR